MFDSNSDGYIVLKELLSIARINVELIKSGHRQVHIGFTEK